MEKAVRRSANPVPKTGALDSGTNLELAKGFEPPTL